MWWTRLLYDAIIVSYAVSLTLFFSDVLQPRRAFNRSAVVLLFVAFLCTTGLLFVRFRAIHAFPAYTRSDLMLFIAWIMLVTTLVLDTFFPIGLVLFFANVVGFFILLFAGYRQGSDVSRWFPNQDLLLLHIILAMVSETALAFSFAFAVMHLLQESNLRYKRWNRWFLLLPPLAKIESLCLVTTAIGFFLLFAAMAVGDVWGKLVLHEWIVWSAKTIATFVIWVMYGVFLFLRVRNSGTTRGLVIFQVICFIATVINLGAIGHILPGHQQVSP
ncbi:cytochrome c biogenesis protein CcsA [Alicyclobacillus fastidiosus]|uniref:Cytochrome c biogenesis protein CcsA n=1 Tax=Alicyclobacillus fastidiosus TaxID=392011 RepID=A0ABV5AG75_9BACL|nr:cytochrome c biogenesis protein CcsA [Alicyclobacillus fastidiosus]WEH11657.1 cytochrome c biogenesis protein CcsA [Alicyclobacillus fastidiosus]